MSSNIWNIILVVSLAVTITLSFHDPKVTPEELQLLNNKVAKVSLEKPEVANSFRLLIKDHPAPKRSDIEEFESFIDEALVAIESSRLIKDSSIVAELQDPVLSEEQERLETEQGIMQLESRFEELKSAGFWSVSIEEKFEYVLLCQRLRSEIILAVVLIVGFPFVLFNFINRQTRKNL